MPLRSENRPLVVAALGFGQTNGWASSDDLPAVLAPAMAATFDHSPVFVFGAPSAAMVISATISPWAGSRIDSKGGRGILVSSNHVFAAGLLILATAPSSWVLACAWAVRGLGMGLEHYEAAFVTVAGIYGSKARGPITGITLIAGFTSTVGWPLSGPMLVTWGWREACLGRVLIHLSEVPLDL
jgi:hypothetical protein